MANFAYTVRTKDGTILKGVYDAANQAMVVTALKNKGYIPLDIKEKSGLNQDVKLSMLNKKVSTKDIAVFCRQFSAVIEAGIPVLECIDIVRRQTESAKMRDVLNSIYEQVQKGRTLSEGFKEFKGEIPSLMIHMVEAGEASGTLDKVMARLAVYFANANKLNGKVVGALTYPAVIGIITFLAAFILIWKVVPMFESMFSSMGADLPTLTKALVSVSKFMSSYIIYIFILIVGSVSGIIYFSKTKQGIEFFDSIVLKLPVLGGLYRKMFAARFTRTMGSLLSAGLPLIESLEITDKVINNSIMSRYLERAREDITKGTKFSAAISQVRIMPTMVVSMVSIGEESGSLDSIMDKTADFFEEETEAAVTSATTLLEPIMIVIMAVVVGTIVASIVLPMFDQFSHIQNG